ncbi:hypothetical protein, partial [Hungatella hathewayi]
SQFADYDAKLDSRFVEYDAKLDSRFVEYDAKLDSRFDDYDAKLDSRFVEYDAKLDSRFDDYDAKLDFRFESTTAYLLSEIDSRIARSKAMLLDEIERIHMQVWENSKKLKQLQKDVSSLRSKDNDFGIIYSYLNKLDFRVCRLESALSPL